MKKTKEFLIRYCDYCFMGYQMEAGYWKYIYQVTGTDDQCCYKCMNEHLRWILDHEAE